MRLLGVHHLLHLIGLRPHAFADLRLARQSAANADVHVPVFVGIDPRLRLYCLFRQHGPCVHAGVNFVTRAVEKTRIDKDKSFPYRMNALLKIDGCASLFVHHANFQCVRFKTE